MSTDLKITFVLVVLFVAVLFGQLPHGIANEETPAGAIDGVNATYNIQFQPLPWAAIKVYRNGLRQKRGLDYLLSGANHTQLVFQLAAIPQPGDVLIADYTY